MIRPIALLSDFGTRDYYAGALRSVILSINPKAQIIDVTHDIRPQAVMDGAFVLRSVTPYLPKGAIAVAVVDPGVGGTRKALCVRTKTGYFIGPDNGVLSLALKNFGTYEARSIENEKFFRKPVSNTFHGRDIFCPVAAWLSLRNVFASLGPSAPRIRELAIPKLKRARRYVQGEIIYIDRFGNAMTNIDFEDLRHVRAADATPLYVKSRYAIKIKSHFGAGGERELIGVWNSTNSLELAVKNGSAAAQYKLKIGDPVQVRLR